MKAVPPNTRFAFRSCGAAAPTARGHRERSSATALAIGFVVTVVVQFGIGQAVRSAPEAFSDPLYHDKRERLRAHSAGAPAGAGRPFALLFLGSSRTYDAVNAGAAAAALTHDLGRPVAAFDFATSGAGPVTLALHLRRLLADGVAPDAVVIEVHPAFLASQVWPPFETCWLRPIRLRPGETSLARDLGFPTDAPGAHGPRGLFLAGYEYRTHLLERYCPELSPLPYRLTSGPETDRHGFVRVPNLLPRQRERLRAWTREQYAPCWTGYIPGGCALAALRDALGTCRAIGVRTALLVTPESAEFRGWYAEPGRARIVPLLNELAREFEAPFVDAREWLPDDLIADGHHLTGTGADVFTERLVRDALAPWLRAQEGANHER
ncbi:hypothetical protein R5W23_000960 [Gemmata sp. JC673]|uniref:SGNH/GDSL hydrolase family protein n=1 Tax=Gemmata algarum TaxID=2975278 RepID=A0ABU5EUM2_9BACT|nr:hypothetical protein [Gemmata algarum]MDY3558152.1 hypothetical protein [Gemmata algarum]